MIKSKADYKEYLAADASALGINTKKVIAIFGGTRYYIYKYQRLLRKCEYYSNCKKGLFYKPYKMYLKFKFRSRSIKYGFEIPLNCFGKGLSIAHIGPIIINGYVKVGDNCRIHPGTCIGTAKGYGDMSPVLGNNVYIGPGAKLFGKITIADNITIGANAVVTKSFEQENVSIAGVPAKIISEKN